MTSYDLAMQECALEYRAVCIIVFKAGLLVVVAS